MKETIKKKTEVIKKVAIAVFAILMVFNISMLTISTGLAAKGVYFDPGGGSKTCKVEVEHCGGFFSHRTEQHCITTGDGLECSNCGASTDCD